MTKRMRFRHIRIASLFLLFCCYSHASAQFLDPNNTLILNTLREISARHNMALGEERAQTAKLVQQLRQFYDTYTLLRNDIEFSQSLYRDFKAMENLDLTQSYALTNFIINGDRADYWFPSLSGDLTRAAMDAQALLNNGEALQQTFESFSVSVNEGSVPLDIEQRRHNALVGNEVFSQAMFEYALKCRVLANTYDSLAVELHEQIMDRKNQFTSAERTQLLVESVKLRDLSNSYYEKYLDLTRQAHDNELNLYEEKVKRLRASDNWKQMRKQVNSISKIRYGFFDLVTAPFE